MTRPEWDVLDLLALYDHDERFAATNPNLRREELPLLVRQVDEQGTFGCVIYSRLSAETADAAIAEQQAYFASIGQSFEWKAYAHDQPPDLVQRLAARGFSLDETEAIMLLDLKTSSPAAFARRTAVPDADKGGAHTPEITRVHSAAELADVASIKERVFGDVDPDFAERLSRELSVNPESLSVYIAWVGGLAVGCAWIRFPQDSAFASLWGGATLPEVRHQGIYTALVAARVSEARQRGLRYLTVDARSTSRPILEKRGFRLLTRATACICSAPG